MTPIDQWNPYPVELHRDYSMSCPAVDMQDGRVLWVELPHTNANVLFHAWELGSDTQWDGPKLDNVTIGETRQWHSNPNAQNIHIKQVCHPDMTVRADLVLSREMLFLEYAE